MSFVKENPVFTAVTGVLVVVSVAGAFLSFQAKGKVEEKENELNQAISSYNSTANQLPSPTAANLDAAREDLSRQQQQFEDFVNSLEETNLERAVFDGQPTAPQDMYFQLQTFAENMRQRARDTEIMVADDENFGFDEFVRPNAPSPAVEDIPRLHRQKVILDYIVNRLFNSVDAGDENGEGATLRIGNIDEPYPASYLMRINAIQREETRPVAPEAATTTGRRPQQPPQQQQQAGQPLQGDVFTINPQISARVEGAIKTDAFRVQFEGRTDALRNFLNGIASFEMPIVIRSVEVVPVTPPGQRPQSRQPASGGAGSLDALFGGAPTQAAPTERIDNIEIVSDNVSRFTVTLEYIDVVRSDSTTDSSETANN